MLIQPFSFTYTCKFKKTHSASGVLPELAKQGFLDTNMQMQWKLPLKNGKQIFFKNWL